MISMVVHGNNDNVFITIVGKAQAISASDDTNIYVKKNTITQDHSWTAGPPVDSENVYNGTTPNSTDIIDAVNPNDVNVLKILLTSCLYPKAANRLSSSVIFLCNDTLVLWSDVLVLDSENLFSLSLSISIDVIDNDDDDIISSYYYIIIITIK